MRRARRTGLAIAVLLGMALLGVSWRDALADAITRVKGTVTDNHGKPLAKVKLYFDAVEIKKHVGPVTTNKEGQFVIATLDVSVAKKWKLSADLPGYKTVQQHVEIVDSEGSEVYTGDLVVGTKQEYPELRFVLVGDEGRNQVDIEMAKDAELVAALQEARKKKEGGAAGGAAAAASAPGSTAAGSAAPGPAAPGAPAAPGTETAKAPPPGSKETLEKAKSLTDAGRHPEAIELYKAYLAKDPTGNPAVYYYLGKSLFESNQLQEAEQAFKKGLELKADMKGAHYFLGNVALKDDRAKDAIPEYEKELALTPDSDSVYYMLGQAYAQSGEDDKALEAFQKTVTINPSKSDAYMKMASIYEKRKERPKAEEMYQKVIATDPKNAAVSFFNIGAHAWNENRDQEAVQAFKKAVEIDPTYAVAHRELARALMRSADFPGAIKQFEEYLKLNPQANDAKEIRDTIAMLKKP
jgi:tetratricopeptide (TPR) repeat protein